MRPNSHAPLGLVRGGSGGRRHCCRGGAHHVLRLDESDRRSSRRGSDSRRGRRGGRGGRRGHQCTCRGGGCGIIDMGAWGRGGSVGCFHHSHGGDWSRGCWRHCRCRRDDQRGRPRRLLQWAPTLSEERKPLSVDHEYRTRKVENLNSTLSREAASAGFPCERRARRLTARPRRGVGCPNAARVSSAPGARMRPSVRCPTCRGARR